MYRLASLYSCFLVAAFIGLPLQSNAQVVLANTTQHQQISSIFYFRAAADTLPIQQVETQKFITLDFTRTSSMGFDRGVHWFRFDVRNQSTEPLWLLEVAYAPLDYVDLYFRDSVGQWVHQSGGDRLPISQRKHKNRHVIFDVPVNANSTLTCYLKIQSTSSVQVPLNFWTAAAFHTQNYEDQFAHGVFYGIMLIMIFYNLFLYLSIRDRITLYYVFTLLAGTNVIAFFQGYGFYYLYPEHPELGDIFSATSGPVFIISSIALTRSFLFLRVFSYELDRILLATAIVSVLTAVAIMVFKSVFTYTSLHILTILDCVLILIAASYCLYRNFRPARYFLLAWVSLLLVGAMFSLRNLGFIQGNWFTNNALYFAGVMQTLLISFALGDRINLLKKENEMSRQRELNRELEANVRLEEEVRVRTEEISSQNAQLESNNAIKDKLFSILSHDLKGPLNSLKGALTIFRMGALNNEEMKKVTSDIEEQLHQTSSFLDNLLQWAKSQMNGEIVRPEKIQIENLVRESTELLLPEFKRKNISLTIQVPALFSVYADPTMIRTVVRNLVSNALKFTLPGGAVKVKAEQEKGKTIVSVEDTGVGIPPTALHQIFSLHGITTSGTREEKGTGIGLVLCKDFVERNGGEIKVESEEGRGTVFWFTLPSANGQH